MRFKSSLGFFILLAGYLLFPAPSSAGNDADEGLPPLRVVATFPILEDWVNAIGGDHVSAYTLVGEGSSVHTYEPLPRDLRRLREADLILSNGLGLEFWLEDLVTASKTKASLLVLSDGMPRLETEHPHPHHHDHPDHGSNSVDPHLWMNPETAVYMVTALAESLAELRPSAAEGFFDRAEQWMWEVREVSFEIRNKFSELPAGHRTLLTHHQNLAYWADYYEFEIIGSALDSVSSHHEDPSAAHIAKLIRLVREKPAVALLYTDKENPDLLRQIARETGMPLVGPLYVESLPPPFEAGSPNNYARLLQYNAHLIFQALAQPQS
jgi:zinc/manganese transport system substrate-binding protein